MQGACDGIHHRKGDFFTYYATGAYLMNRYIIIENLAVSRADDYEYFKYDEKRVQKRTEKSCSIN